jgi:hypothetical protein
MAKLWCLVPRRPCRLRRGSLLRGRWPRRSPCGDSPARRSGGGGLIDVSGGGGGLLMSVAFGDVCGGLRRSGLLQLRWQISRFGSEAFALPVHPRVRICSLSVGLRTLLSRVHRRSGGNGASIWNKVSTASAVSTAIHSPSLSVSLWRRGPSRPVQGSSSSRSCGFPLTRGATIVGRHPRRAPEFSGDLSVDVVGSAVCSCRSGTVGRSACVVYAFLCSEQILQLCNAV